MFPFLLVVPIFSRLPLYTTRDLIPSEHDKKKQQPYHYVTFDLRHLFPFAENSYFGFFPSQDFNLLLLAMLSYSFFFYEFRISNHAKKGIPVTWDVYGVCGGEFSVGDWVGVKSTIKYAWKDGIRGFWSLFKGRHVMSCVIFLVGIRNNFRCLCSVEKWRQILSCGAWRICLEVVSMLSRGVLRDLCPKRVESWFPDTTCSFPAHRNSQMLMKSQILSKSLKMD